MTRPLQFGVKVLLTLATLTRLAPGCGDPPTKGLAGTTAKLVIQTQDGVVRIGEPIFASLILPKGSPLPTGTISRASCTSLQFTVDALTGWHDPWADWYYSGIPEHATGRDGPLTCGIIAYAPGQEIPPPQITFTLNDWIEFDRPGKYRISVTYHTEFRKPQDWLDDPYDDRKSTVNVRLVTEPVEIEVLPESPNVATRVSDELALLRSHFRSDDPRSFGPDSAVSFPEWAQYSHSEAVIPLLAQFYEQYSNEARRGLITSPHRKLVVQEMEKELVDPRHSVDFNFPAELAFLAAEVQHPELFGAGGGNSRGSAWEQASKKRNEVFLQLLAQYTRQLLSSLPQKHEVAQRDGLSAALTILVRWDPPGKSELRKQAAEEAARLIPKMKEEPYIRGDEWEIIATPALLPYLRKSQGAEQLRLRYELAPQEAKRSMFRAAAREDWATAVEWARVLPEGERPSNVLDAHLSKSLQQESDDEERESRNWILFRLGGPDLILPVQKMLASESCLGDSALWAYLLKQQGPVAGRELIRRYEQDSKDPTCDADLPFQQIWLNYPVRYWSAQVEGIIVPQLKIDSLAIGAAHILERLGSANSEAALWTRLEEWHRSPPLRPREGPSILPENDLEAALQAALLNGRSWAPEPALIHRLRDLCVYQCDELKWARSIDQVQHLTISEWNPGNVSFMSASYPIASDEFKDWILRFPAGTEFAINVWPGGAPLTASQVKIKYPNVGQLMRKRNLKILDTLPYDEYGRCKAGNE